MLTFVKGITILSLISCVLLFASVLALYPKAKELIATYLRRTTGAGR